MNNANTINSCIATQTTHSPVEYEGTRRHQREDVGHPRAHWRARLAAWSPVILCGLILAALGAHQIVLWEILDPAENFWLNVKEDASSYYLWGNRLYRELLWVSGGLILVGMTLSVLARWRPGIRRLAQVATVLGALSLAATQLLQPEFWSLGAGLPDWSWGLPLRLSLMTLAVGALWLQRRPELGWPRWLLTGAFGVLVALMLIPQPTRAQQPSALWMYCTVYKPQCGPPPKSCRGRLEVPHSDAAIPAAQLLHSIPIRLKARQRLADRDALHADPRATPKAWKFLAGDHRFEGTQPWKDMQRELDNEQLHLLWQDARLLSLGLVLLLGLMLLLAHRLRPHGHGWRWLPIPLALAAVITATGLLPELSHVYAPAHLPTALFIPLAVALVWATVTGQLTRAQNNPDLT